MKFFKENLWVVAVLVLALLWWLFRPKSSPDLGGKGQTGGYAGLEITNTWQAPPSIDWANSLTKFGNDLLGIFSKNWSGKNGTDGEGFNFYGSTNGTEYRVDYE